MVRYHTRLYDPYDIASLVPTFIRRTRLSKHARYKVQASSINLRWPITNAYPFEYYVDDGNIVKVVFRAPYDQTWDICLVVDYVNGKITTVWLVSKDYHHENLDTSLYERCPHG
jgi:hypothetical protein